MRRDNPLVRLMRSVSGSLAGGEAGSWVSIVNRAESEAELAALRRAVARGRPYGDDRWSQRTAKALGTESSLRPIGGPSKSRSRKKN